MMTNKTTAWTALWSALRAMDGDAWDAESDRLDILWVDEYKAAFVAHALTRKWSRQDAEEWAGEIANEALQDARGDNSNPADVARRDVIACEMEAASVL